MPKQHKLIYCTEPNAAFVGGEGSGKTASLVTSCIIESMNEPDGLTLMGRLNMPALESSTMHSFLEMVPEQYGEWADTKKTFTFSNRHELVFRHLDITDPKTKGHIKSMNLSRAYIDESSEVSQEVFFLLLGRVRRKSTERHTIKMASNPAGHDWQWRYFFDPDRKEKFKELNLGITVSSFDNPFLPEDYKNRIYLYPEDWADRFIHGHFSDFSDLVYKEFGEDSHVWDDSKGHIIFGGLNTPPPDWPVIVGMDIGSDIDPWAVPLISVAPNGFLFQFAEVYGRSLLIRNISEQIKQKLQGRPIDGLAYDYANRQAALELAEYDIAGSPAIKEVRPGLFKTAQYFHVDPRIEHPFNAKVAGSPRYFVAASCIETRREITGYKWAKDRSGNATGEPSHENSHSPDAIRYAIHTFRPLPEKLGEPKLWENPNLDPLSRMYWRNHEELRDRMEKLSPKAYGLGGQRTIQEWIKLAMSAPKRFQRPGRSNYQKAWKM